MSNRYDDAKYGVINRKWFGLTKKFGGDCAAGYTSTGSGTTTTHLARWYPKGPIRVIKAGHMVLATLATADNATGGAVRSVTPIKFYHSGNDGTSRAINFETVNMQIGDDDTTSRQALYGIASDAPTANNTIAAGQFLTIYAATPQSGDATAAAAAGTLADGGTYAFFIDYVPVYSGTKWDS